MTAVSRAEHPTTIEPIDHGLVRRIRDAAGLTQVELARRAGVTQSMISRWERGGDLPRLDTLAKVARAAGFRIELVLVANDGVDRAQIRDRLTATPEERVRHLERAVSQIHQLRRGRR